MSSLATEVLYTKEEIMEYINTYILQLSMILQENLDLDYNGAYTGNCVINLDKILSGTNYAIKDILVNKYKVYVQTAFRSDMFIQSKALAIFTNNKNISRASRHLLLDKDIIKKYRKDMFV